MCVVYACPDLQDSLPKYLMDMFQNAHKHPSGKRARETEIINQAFDKKGGRWIMNLDKPYFQKESAQYHKKFCNDKQHAIPRALAIKEWGCAETLDAAIEAKQAKQFMIDGVPYVSWRIIEVGKEDGGEHKLVVKEVLLSLT